MTEVKTIDLSTEHDDHSQAKQTILRSPLAGSVDNSVAEKGAFKVPEGLFVKPINNEQPLPPNNEGLPELNALAIKDDESSISKTLKSLIEWVLVLTLLFGIGWVVKTHVIPKLEKNTKFREIEHRSVAYVMQMTQRVLPNFGSKKHSAQHAAVEMAEKHETAMAEKGLFATSDCSASHVDKLATMQRKSMVGKSYLNLCECAFYVNAPRRALDFSGEGLEAERALKIPNPNDVLPLKINYIRAKYKMWANFADFKDIKSLCRNWAVSGECVERLVLESYFHGGTSSEKGFSTLNNNKNFPKDVRATILLSGARVALKDGRHVLAEERLREANNIVAKDSFGLRKEIFETQLFDAYATLNGSLSLATKAQAQASFSKIDKTSTTELDALSDFIASKAVLARRKSLIRYMNTLVWESRFNVDPYFLGAIGFEAIINRDTESYLAFLARVSKWFIDGGNVDIGVRRVLDRWHIRAFMAGGQYAEASQLLTRYEKNFGADAFKHHFQSLVILKSRSQKDTWVKVIQECDLALRMTPNWQTMYVKGLALIEDRRFGDVPAVISAMEKFGGSAAANNFTFYLKVDFLWAQGKTDLALKNIDNFLAKYGQSPAALEVRDRISRRPKGKGEFNGAVLVRPAIDSFGPFRNELRNDPLGPFAIADF